jgi:transposase
MARKRLEPNPANATAYELKNTDCVGTNETGLRCNAIQMLIVGITREHVCAALFVTERALRKWIQLFNEKSIDGLIVNKRPGRTAIFRGSTAVELTQLIEQPAKADRTFRTAKAFHGYLSQTYQIQCSYQTVARFFHRQGFALKLSASTKPFLMSLTILKEPKLLLQSERLYEKRYSIQSNKLLPKYPLITSLQS